MTPGISSGHCSNCRYVFPDPVAAAAEPAGTPCPKCGKTTGRTFEVGSDDFARGYEFVKKLKGKRPGEKKPHLEVQAGYDSRKSRGDFVDKFRRIDRDNDWYDEVLMEDDGTVIHETHEPLSQHRNHGSAKAADAD